MTSEQILPMVGVVGTLVASFFLVAKYGTQRSAVTLARAIPVAGGLVGGSVDAALTGVIGKAAKKAFAREQD